MARNELDCDCHEWRIASFIYRCRIQMGCSVSFVAIAHAQREVGQLYLQGQGVHRDYGKAVNGFTVPAKLETTTALMISV